MSFSILLAEPKSVENLYPFSLLHCAWEIRCGALRLFEKFQSRFADSPISFSGRGANILSFSSRFLKEYHQPKGNLLIVHAGLLLTHTLALIINKSISSELEQSIIFTSNSQVIACYIPEHLNNTQDQEFQPTSPFFDDYLLNPALKNATSREVEAHIITYLWDAIHHNGNALIDDSDLFTSVEPMRSSPLLGVYVENPDMVYCGEDCSIAPHVVLDASNGPIIIGNKIRIMPQSTIIGPCYIGDNSIIKIGAKIYGNTSIGEHCKVGGEIDTSIIHAYSSKQHDGFVGNSYIGEWVNLGADCNTSNLKNTYGNVSVQLNGEQINTGEMFLGLLCGDHTKAGINTMFTTGTVAGIFSNIVGGGFFPQSISSFNWGGLPDSPRYLLEKAISVAEIVMKRRNYIPTEEEKALWKSVFDYFANFS